MTKGQPTTAKVSNINATVVTNQYGQVISVHKGQSVQQTVSEYAKNNGNANAVSQSK